MTKNFAINDLLPFIDWRYFYHAWQIDAAPEDVKENLKSEAMEVLREWQKTKVVRTLWQKTKVLAGADKDEIVTDSIRFHCPRQNHAPFISLADYAKIGSEITFFATTFNEIITDDVFDQMLQQTLADRLSEAASEKLSQEWAREDGGLAFAVGYPSLPDQSLIFDFDRVLNLSQIGIRLTETGMMIPHASVCAVFVPGKNVKYFSV